MKGSVWPVVTSTAYSALNAGDVNTRVWGPLAMPSSSKRPSSSVTISFVVGAPPSSKLIDMVAPASGRPVIGLQI